MGRNHPLAVKLRSARDATDPRLSNRAIARLAGVSAPTVDRLMNGDVDTKVSNLDAVADVLKIRRSEARKLAGLPATDGDPYMGPDESRLLNRRQRDALDELIRAFAMQDSVVLREQRQGDDLSAWRHPVDESGVLRPEDGDERDKGIV